MKVEDAYKFLALKKNQGYVIHPLILELFTLEDEIPEGLIHSGFFYHTSDQKQVNVHLGFEGTVMLQTRIEDFITHIQDIEVLAKNKITELKESASKIKFTATTTEDDGA